MITQITFHHNPNTSLREKAYVKQGFFVFWGGVFFLGATPVSILPSALFCERLFARCKLGVLRSAGAAT